jgi:hypothetical protein
VYIRWLRPSEAGSSKPSGTHELALGLRAVGRGGCKTSRYEARQSLFVLGHHAPSPSRARSVVLDERVDLLRLLRQAGGQLIKSQLYQLVAQLASS